MEILKICIRKRKNLKINIQVLIHLFQHEYLLYYN